ncbi:2-succinyl-5-enolpyruvyl-6-hydroxy-3-cyclohexene-1-carboxylic-acid synthase [Thermosynechococcus sp. PP22]|uniref:2-succinyl-5-enolpyruvyl-6-hydroxy-3- cyclohexene-1-carboxylic-acid synthase n=1 Tax=unclassified Thermosynechococcus TaxID=2622553 RepID=UPI002872BB60|nr:MULTISPECIES: 2-succinyl-5-enolpyruvyl-6-hydroxy-3-cyclohexene-1-carboxylic-acid synthase [unclassified Thermosynechococcus]WNC22044.1 2-succinyl-5-enolpyruvyl-6-hydroxy-3-cyclohexene-1-carboxylic-acid synthase [Thermosynechococcus sp. PP22]WNC52506.1 2-succinyl-5-enolpyruvyl-6-hydroxy-3-cyclohexene-1-carboxylic-acid synthase [Thermosynechococcus sp. TG215]WNC57592.1 2-succinyl-5-enolpyruvyl-6-hydroxy-3-cyclohexene-1-carboxylic-acid synthase [Thermosynechococcus sp. TG218]
MILTENLNVLWASVLFETLYRLGLRTVVLSPGSRSGPLAIAAAAHPHLEALPILDERSAAFFALGLVQQQGRPVALVCTSGTAAANFYPAIIEASLSHLPLIVLTADRPPELRFCQAGQAIDQVHLYGHAVRHYRELSLPELALLPYLRQTLCHSWQTALWPDPGPVHLNIPLRDPLDLRPEANFHGALPENFFDQVQPFVPPRVVTALPWQTWQQMQRGLIIAGPSHGVEPLAEADAIDRLSRFLQWPVLADALSYARGLPHGITHYDLLLRNGHLRESLRPEAVIQLGPLPTSKALREWLSACDPLIWCLDPTGDNNNPLHGRCQTLAIAPQDLDCPPDPLPPNPYLKDWQDHDQRVHEQLKRTLEAIDWFCEAKLIYHLPQWLPSQTAIFVASSMPVRDVESVWRASDRHHRFYFNRGANGIDGTLSSAFGVAHRGQPTLLITGDLACLHDTNGWLITPQFQGCLTVLLINNNGGGIFEHLPIRRFDPPFESFFATPQAVNFAQLAAAYGIPYHCLQDWADVKTQLSLAPWPKVRLLEFKSDRQQNAQWRQQVLAHLTI